MRPIRCFVTGVLLAASAIVAAQDCSEIAGDWQGNWSETDCFDDDYSGEWTGSITDSCEFSAVDSFGNIQGTIDPLTGVLTASLTGGECGTLTLTGTFQGSSGAGSWTYAGGGGGSFSGIKLIVDSDGDGVPDDQDAFPNDPNESVDTDSDGIGNNADPDDDGDTMPDDYENANGLNSLNPSDAAGDADGDGFTNLEEFQAGTDPQNPDDFPPDKGVPIAIYVLLSEATVNYDEEQDGDISGVYGQGPVFTLGTGVNTVTGVGNTPDPIDFLDFDVFSIVIPSGHRLASISLENWASQTTSIFMRIREGAQSPGVIFQWTVTGLNATAQSIAAEIATIPLSLSEYTFNNAGGQVVAGVPYRWVFVVEPAP